MWNALNWCVLLGLFLWTPYHPSSYFGLTRPPFIGRPILNLSTGCCFNSKCKAKFYAEVSRDMTVLLASWSKGKKLSHTLVKKNESAYSKKKVWWGYNYQPSKQIGCVTTNLILATEDALQKSVWSQGVNTYFQVWFFVILEKFWQC